MFPGKGKDLPKPFRKKTGPQLLPRPCVFSARRLPVQAGKTLLCPFLCCAAAGGIFMVRQKPVGIVDPGIAQHLSVGYAGTAVLLGDGILHGGVAAGEGAVTSVGGVLVVLVIAGPVVLVAIIVVVVGTSSPASMMSSPAFWISSPTVFWPLLSWLVSLSLPPQAVRANTTRTEASKSVNCLFMG